MYNEVIFEGKKKEMKKNVRLLIVIIVIIGSIAIMQDGCEEDAKLCHDGATTDKKSVSNNCESAPCATSVDKEEEKCIYFIYINMH